MRLPFVVVYFVHLCASIYNNDIVDIDQNYFVQTRACIMHESIQTTTINCELFLEP